MAEIDTLARDQQIVRTSTVGIAGNVALAALKAVTGLATGSIAVVLDAVNNLSDALSSLITIVGTRLAARPADREHPYGYGRMEYLSAIVIAAIVLAAGVTSLREAASAILHPAVPSYDVTSVAILAVAVGVKVALGLYFRSVGRRVSSDSLLASGTDALLDAAISLGTVVAAVLYLGAGVGVEAWLAALISLVIVRSGVEMLQETLSKVLGERVDGSLAREVKGVVESVEGVRGAYDLTLNDYGPERLQGSVHVGVDDALTAPQIDALTKRVQLAVFEQCGVALQAVGIYASNTADPVARDMRERAEAIVAAHDHIREMHGFYVDQQERTVRFDVIVGFEAQDRSAVRDEICAECQEAFPGYAVTVVLDADVSD